MSKQRSRRAFLAAGGGVALGGCVVAGATPGLLGGGPTVDVLAAGSLLGAFDERVGPAFAAASAFDYRGEYRGSNAVVRLVDADQKNPDVVVVADPSLLRESAIAARVGWDVTFATNELGIAYAPETRVGRRLDDGQPWYRVLANSDAAIGRTDPNIDPLGYRTLMLFDLASRYYDRPELATELRDNSVIAARESHLLAGIEGGSRPAAFCYRNMAADHGLPFVELPVELNFADPAQADHYATASYTTDRGTIVRGGPISYAATVPNSADRPAAGREFVRFLLSNPDLLRERGLAVPEALPRASGRPPTGIRRALGGE